MHHQLTLPDMANDSDDQSTYDKQQPMIYQDERNTIKR